MHETDLEVVAAAVSRVALDLDDADGVDLVVSELPAGPGDVLVHCLADCSLALAQIVFVAGESRTAIVQF